MSSLLTVNKAKTTSMLLIGDVICLPKDAVTKVQASGGGLKLAEPARRFTVRQSIAIIRDVFPARLQTRAIAIARRETHLNAAAYNSCCVGLFQINWEPNKPWLIAMGITSPQQLLDARDNARAAYMMYKRNSGWKPWE